MKKLLLSSILIFFSYNLFAQSLNSWSSVDTLPAPRRSAAFSFSIGNKGYVGGGFSFSDTYQDFWEFDPANGAWTQKANFGGGKRSGAVAFSIGGKGYVATGLDDNGVRKADIWEYNPVNDTWTQKTSLPGAARNYAVGLSIGNKGYVGTGETSVSFVALNDFWEYNPSTDSWTQKANIPGPQRSSAIGFGIGNKGYLGTGDTCNNVPSCFALNDFFEYDPANNSWTQKTSTSVSLRDQGTAFVINGRGYLCTGTAGGFTTTDLIEYTPSSNIWTVRASIPGSAKSNSVSFAIGNHGYAGAGFDAGFNVSNDFYEYTPADTTADTLIIPSYINEIRKEFMISIAPDPVTNDCIFAVQYPNESQELLVEIFDICGRNVVTLNHPENNSAGHAEFYFTKNDLKNGIYFYALKSDGIIAGKGKFLVQ